MTKKTAATININGTDYKIKPTLRAFFIMEQITGKTFNIESMLDNYIFFYSMLLANNPDNIMEWDAFIEALDDDPTILIEFNEVLAGNEKIDKLLNPDGEESDKKK